MLRFVRQKSFSYVLEKPPSERWGFLFSLAVGFSKEVDPLSGMTVSLPVVDQWIAEFIAQLPQQKYSEISALFHSALGFFSAKAPEQKAQFSFLQLKEERNWSLSWDSQLAADFSLWHRECSFFLETFHADSPVLLRIYFVWQIADGKDSSDYTSPSLKLLKASGLDSSASLEHNTGKLKALIGKTLSENSVLKQIRVESKDPAYVLILE